MALKKVESQYLDFFWKYLTLGASTQLKDKESQSDLITGFSPNNIRRVILGLDGIFIQRYVSEQSGFVKKLDYRELRLKTDNLLPLMMTRHEETEYVPATAMLYKYRVFSSIEEIIILKRSPFYQGVSFDNHGLGYFLNDTAKSRFKRLRYVTIVDSPVSVEEIAGRFGEVLSDPLMLLSPELAKHYKIATKQINDREYIMHTSLRPQHYSMDTANGILANYFTSTKQTWVSKNQLAESEAYRKERQSETKQQPVREPVLKVDKSFIAPYNELRILVLKLDNISNETKKMFESLHKMVNKQNPEQLKTIPFKKRWHSLAVDYDSINIATLTGLFIVKDYLDLGFSSNDLKQFSKEVSLSLLVDFKKDRELLKNAMIVANHNLNLILTNMEEPIEYVDEFEKDEFVESKPSNYEEPVPNDEFEGDVEFGEEESLEKELKELGVSSGKHPIVTDYIPNVFVNEFSKLALPLKPYILNFDTDATEPKEVYDQFLAGLEDEVNRHNLAIPLTLLITGRKMQPIKVNHRIALHPQLYYVFEKGESVVITNEMIKDVIEQLELVCRLPEITQVTDLAGVWERVNKRGGWTDDII